MMSIPTVTKRSAIQATWEARSTAEELRAALASATPLEAIILIQLSERAEILARDIEAFAEAVE